MDKRIKDLMSGVIDKTVAIQLGALMGDVFAQANRRAMIEGLDILHNCMEDQLAAMSEEEAEELVGDVAFNYLSQVFGGLMAVAACKLSLTDTDNAEIFFDDINSAVKDIYLKQYVGMRKKAKAAFDKEQKAERDAKAAADEVVRKMRESLKR